jgi:cobyrinic acid a,c-diamide synthase
MVDCTKMTGTAGALVLGCRKLNPRVKIAGVILNRVAGSRHLKILKSSVERNAGVPVVGAIPKLRDVDIFERHLGLVPPQEHARSAKVIQHARKIAEKHLDLKAILKVAREAGKISHRNFNIQHSSFNILHSKYSEKRVGIIRDKAFQFYYPENIEAFKNLGADVIEISAIKDRKLPDLDLLYIGGGFPETSARLLQKNVSFRKSLKQAVNRGLPVYAECGGVIYLGRKLYFRGKAWSMTGVFNIDFDFSEKPRGHGYTILKIMHKNPFFKVGSILKGHEFHYTAPKSCKGARLSANVQRGFGFDGKRDGLIYKNVFATYSHINAFSLSNWAGSLLCS